MKLIPKMFNRSNSKISNGNRVGDSSVHGGCMVNNKIKWELRPGGMLVQKREDGGSMQEGVIKLRVSIGAECHNITIQATSTFGALKMILSLVTGLKPTEQRLLFKGKEREDGDYLHMVGVGNLDKVLLLEDPAITEKKRTALAKRQAMGNGNLSHTISL